MMTPNHKTPHIPHMLLPNGIRYSVQHHRAVMPPPSAMTARKPIFSKEYERLIASKIETIDLCSDDAKGQASMPPRKDMRPLVDNGDVKALVRNEMHMEKVLPAAPNQSAPSVASSDLYAWSTASTLKSKEDTVDEAKPPSSPLFGSEDEESDQLSDDENDDVDVTRKWRNEYWVGGDEEMMRKYGFTAQPPQQSAPSYGKWLKLNKDAIAREYHANGAYRLAEPVAQNAQPSVPNGEIENQSHARCRWCIQKNLPCVYRPNAAHRTIMCHECRQFGRKARVCGVNPARFGVNPAQTAAEMERRAVARARALQNRQDLVARRNSARERRAAATARQQTCKRVAEATNMMPRQRVHEADMRPAALPQVARPREIAKGGTEAVSMILSRNQLAARSVHTRTKVVPLIKILRTIAKTRLCDTSKSRVFTSLSTAPDCRDLAFYIDLMEKVFQQCGDIDGLVQTHAAFRNAKLY